MPKRVHGHGPDDAYVMFVGEAPGWEEDKAGRPFVGKMGDEVRRFCDGNTLPALDDIFVTNLHREYRGRDYEYTAEDVAIDELDLLRELRQVRPSIIVPLGRIATRWFLGDVDMDAVQGIPWLLPSGSHPHAQDRLQFLAPDTVVFPIVNPAAGFHNPEMSPYVVSGFEELGAFLDGHTKARGLFDDPIPHPHYEEITTLTRLLEVLTELQEPINLGFDTEGSPAAPWSLQITNVAGEGYTVRTRHRALVRAFGMWLDTHRPRLTFHSALHDLPMMRALGLPTDLPFDDTMVMSYLLQLEPQGLKPLAVRWCGMNMRSYDEVLGDASQALAFSYFSALWDVCQLEHEQRREDAFWAAIDAGRKIRVYPKLPKTDLHKAVERALQSKNSRALWERQVDDIQVAAYNLLGPIPEATLDHADETDALVYASRDPDATVRVRDQLSPKIDAHGLRDVYNLELSTYPLIERMAYVGLKPDLDHFARLSARLQGEIDRLQGDLNTLAWEGFNANSGAQVAELVFDRWSMECMKKTREGRCSTNDKILEALEREHPELPGLSTIRSFRELYKLKNTFVDRVPDFVHRWPFDGRVHATFRTTRVVTGRLAASDPNILAMPKHGQFAPDFRAGWVEDDGFILAEWDLSQIELRVLAHLSRDPVLLGVFRGTLKNPDGSPMDLHANLAVRIFGGTPEDHKKGTGRLAAKAINFGLPMGMTYKGLTVELRKNGVHVTEDDAQRWIDETMRLYKAVPVYQDAMIAEARRKGYVRMLSGRIRYIGGIKSRSEITREEAKRFAFSTPIQEGAQWLMKQAEARLWTDILKGHFWKRGVPVEPLIQVHDALTLRAPDDPAVAQELNALMVKNMTTAPKGFLVPIETSGDWGYNWADRKVNKETGIITNERGMRAFAEIK